MKGGKRPNAGLKKGFGRWGDAKTVRVTLPESVKTWWDELMFLVKERHLAAKQALKAKRKKFDA